MKYVSSAWLGLTAVFALFIAMLGCQSNDTAVAVPKTIADQIREDSQFSLLRAAMLYAGVGDALKGANLTLFAPNDAAFQASGFSSAAALTALPKDQVRNILLYHVLYSSVPSANLPSGLNSVETAGKRTAFINKTNSGPIYVNGAQLTQADVPTANGVIHVIDQVLIPPTGSLLKTIQTNPDLTYLAAAVKRISATNPSLLALLDTTSATTSPVTLFAPSNAAFQADSRFSTISAIEAANPQTLSNVLLYHTVSGVVFSDQLLTGTISTLLTNNRVTTTVRQNQITIKGNRNATAAVIRKPDQVATNGVIHVIDQVLLP